jgi:hypothetical protein
MQCTGLSTTLLMDKQGTVINSKIPLYTYSTVKSTHAVNHPYLSTTGGLNSEYQRQGPKIIPSSLLWADSDAYGRFNPFYYFP